MVVHAVLALHRFNDVRHSRHRFNRVGTYRCFRAEHDRICAVQYGVGYVIDLCSRGNRSLNHRLHHLGRNDHRLAQAHAALDDVLLDQRHFLLGDLHPQVPTRNHHRIGLLEDAIEVFQRLGFLNLGDDSGVLALRLDALTEFHNVLGVAHKRQANPIHVLL